MRFRACAYTPKSCACPLEEKQKPFTMAEATQCTCCKHLSQFDSQWSRHHYCDGGKRCIYTAFPYRIQMQWETMWRCVTVVGMGALDISVEKFKFFISDILEIDKSRWEELYDIFAEMLSLYQKYSKENTAHISAEDIALIKELSQYES